MTDTSTENPALFEAASAPVPDQGPTLGPTGRTWPDLP